MFFACEAPFGEHKKPRVKRGFLAKNSQLQALKFGLQAYTAGSELRIVIGFALQ